MAESKFPASVAAAWLGTVSPCTSKRLAPDYVRQYESYELDNRDVRKAELRRRLLGSTHGLGTFHVFVSKAHDVYLLVTPDTSYPIDKLYTADLQQRYVAIVQAAGVTDSKGAQQPLPLPWEAWFRPWILAKLGAIGPTSLSSIDEHRLKMADGHTCAQCKAEYYLTWNRHPTTYEWSKFYHACSSAQKSSLVL